MPPSLRKLSPLRVIIGSEDVTQYISDGWTFSNVDPGGFEAFNGQFPKDLPEILRGQYIRVDSGLGVAWEGRVSQVQRSLGHNTTVMGEGYGALFKDAAAAMVFVDRDLTQWQGPSYSRQAALAAAGTYGADGSPNVTADQSSGNPGIQIQCTDQWSVNQQPICEGFYRGIVPIGEAYYSVSTLGNTQTTDANWTWQLMFWSDDRGNGATLTEGTGNLRTLTPHSGYVTSPSNYEIAVLQMFYANVAGGAANYDYSTFWQNLAIYGIHGLPGRGPDPVGFYPSDIFGWVLGQVPGLQAGVVQQTDAGGYIVPHYVQYVPVTLDTMVSDMATIQGWTWGVWESEQALTGNSMPRADFRPRPAPGAYTASCRRQDCDTLDIREDLSQQYNQAVVTYTDVAGLNGAVTVTADNPILDEAGIASRTVVFSGGTMTAATAALFGQEALLLTNQQARVAGTADVMAAINGGTRPAWTLKAGIDRIRVMDVPSTDAFGSMSDFPITRVEASISSSGFTTSVEIGSGADLIETLQARLAAATALAGQGGI